MSGTSRRKGQRGEREVVELLRAAGFPHARRTLAGDGRQPGDVTGGPPGWLVEVKYHADVAAAVRIGLAQAENERRAAELPAAVVAVRLPNTHGAWVAVMRVEYADLVWPCRAVAQPGATIEESLRRVYARGAVWELTRSRDATGFVAAPFVTWAIDAAAVTLEAAP